MSDFNGSPTIDPLNLNQRFSTAAVISPYQASLQAAQAANAALGAPAPAPAPVVPMSRPASNGF